MAMTAQVRHCFSDGLLHVNSSTDVSRPIGIEGTKTNHSNLAFEWAVDLQRSCSEEVQSILLNKKKYYTRKCYAVKWKRFCLCFQKHNLFPEESGIPPLLGSPP